MSKKTNATSEDNNGWKLSQVFGDKGPVEDITEADIISTVEFDHTGEFLATGDKGGRVVLFEQESQKSGAPIFNFYSEFQSHEPEFDYLKSLEIEERINKIKWCKRQNKARFLISSNDKTIKLWKIYDQSISSISGFNTIDENGHPRDPSTVTHVEIPNLEVEDIRCTVVPRRVYSHAHQYHINSISISSDDEHYISADDLRINLWALDNNKEAFTIVDIKPANMEELTEVITAAEFHPISSNIFAYSSSKGTIKLCDMREKALCDNHHKLFEEEEDAANRSFFSEIISSISDIKFSLDGRYIISRDYLTVKVWDVNMENKPIKTYNVHDYLKSKLCDLYENDCIFDKFECAWNQNNDSIVTGSYHNMFHIYDKNGSSDVCLEATKISKKSGFMSPIKFGSKKKKAQGEINVDNINFNQKVLHHDWHPNSNLLAVAATNNLYMFNKP